MGKTCEMKYKTLDSPLGKIEISGCEQGLHGIRLLSQKSSSTDPVEAPAIPEALSSPEGMTEPLMQCTAWLDAYFHKPAAIKGLPLPAFHHPVFQQAQKMRLVHGQLATSINSLGDSYITGSNFISDKFSFCNTSDINSEGRIPQKESLPVSQHPLRAVGS
ncbi:methylated-DNA--protein-cysteine methyltransferase isoform X2 [Fukomys damarensis]|uniref:methylated-DNA--protein-cysteine methyltransferase isoform X2 n=1 Tax=Fukomys damarensis TaxID=885580 RepID=UPI00053F8D97|nr:methylated-DNA--protein-cysteine methyltransferase isoform X2 [Fukomys damarensis]